MKKLVKPEIEFVKFDMQDVITTSGGGDGSVYNFATGSTTPSTPESINENQNFVGLGWNTNQ